MTFLSNVNRHSAIKRLYFNGNIHNIVEKIMKIKHFVGEAIVPLTRTNQVVPKLAMTNLFQLLMFPCTKHNNSHLF